MTLETLLAYDNWANSETLNTLLAGSTPRATKLMAHIVAAELVWMSRIRGEQQPIAVWPELTIEECREIASGLADRWGSILEDFAGDLSSTQLRYTNSMGETFTNSVEQIILQVVTHSGYHRGQIAFELRAAGFAPPSTDFIVAVRQGHVA